MLICRVQCFKEANQRLDLGRRQILSVRGHIAAARDDFEAHLVDRQARSHIVERRTAFASRSADGVAIAALLGLKDDASFTHERRGLVDAINGQRIAASRAHMRAPRGCGSQLREDAPGNGDG